MIRTVARQGAERRSVKLTRPSKIYQQASRLLQNGMPLLPSERPYNITLCHAKRFLWFRVAKVATRTIFQLFDDAAVKLDADHAVACYYPVKLYRDYFKFAFVRNPWDRLVSAWHNKVGEQNYFNFEQETYKNVQNFAYFVDYLVAQWDRLKRDVHLCPQSNLIDLNQIDYIGRFEQLEADLGDVMQRLGLDQITIPHVNASQHRRDYHTYYDEALQQKVAHLYQKDIRLFSYKFSW